MCIVEDMGHGKGWDIDVDDAARTYNT